MASWHAQQHASQQHSVMTMPQNYVLQTSRLMVREVWRIPWRTSHGCVHVAGHLTRARDTAQMSMRLPSVQRLHPPHRMSHTSRRPCSSSTGSSLPCTPHLPPQQPTRPRRPQQTKCITQVSTLQLRLLVSHSFSHSCSSHAASVWRDDCNLSCSAGVASGFYDRSDPRPSW